MLIGIEDKTKCIIGDKKLLLIKEQLSKIILYNMNIQIKKISNKIPGVIFFIALALIMICTKNLFIHTALGSNYKISLYNSCIAPISSGFLGNIWGIIVICFVKLLNILFFNGSFGELSEMILPSLGLPTIAAMLYFGKKTVWSLLFSIGAFIIFNMHPVGQNAWQYSLFWMIPIVCYFYFDRSLFARCLGATFTAHAVGSIIWLYCFSLTAQQWLELIPIVAYERLSIGMGMFAIYASFYYGHRIILAKNQNGYSVLNARRKIM